jgi:hypothetical protein
MPRALPLPLSAEAVASQWPASPPLSTRRKSINCSSSGEPASQPQRASLIRQPALSTSPCSAASVEWGKPDRFRGIILSIQSKNGPSVCRAQPVLTRERPYEEVRAMAEPIVAKQRNPWRRSASTDRDGMSLPAGKTCGDCVHIHRCQAIFGHIPADEVCDWAPSRFREIGA